MGERKGHCTACEQTFELDGGGNIPLHTKPIVGQCYGSDKPPMSGTPGNRGQLPDGNFPADRDVGTRMSMIGHPGSGRRR